jgi:hypothetical protein
MATFQAIGVTSKAILGLLEDACPRELFQRAQFQLYQAEHFEKPPVPMNEGVSLYLYRVAFNTNRRNMPPRRDPTGKRFRPPTPLDLWYLLTAWAGDAERQQWLLGWAIRTLEETPILPSGFLNRFGSDGVDVFDATETVELVGDQVSLQDMVNIWEVAKAKQQPSIAYVARLVAIDSTVEMIEAKPVQTRVIAPGGLVSG